jgi:hypothetical protein
MGPLLAALALLAATRMPPVKQQLLANTQRLMDAVASGDKAVWSELLDDAFVVTDENGAVMMKKELVDGMRPLPAGYSGSIKVMDGKVRLFGDTAVVTYRDFEDETVFGQKIHADYLATDTWVKRGGKWRLVASQVMVVPQPRRSPPSTRRCSTPISAVTSSPDVFYSVTREGSTLFGQRTGRGKEELVPARDDTFFRKGTWRGEKIFVPDASGHVTQLLDRRDNNDIVSKRID